MSCRDTITLPPAGQPPLIAGERWDGMSCALSSNGTTFAEELESVDMVLTLAGTTTPFLTLSSPNDITITSSAPNAWAWTVNPRTAPDAGTYSFKMPTTAVDGLPKSYHRGTITFT